MSLRAGAASAAHDLDEAIWRTIAYAGVFQFPLRLPELRRRLLDVAADEDQIAARLLGPRLRGRVAVRAGYVFPAGCERWVDERGRRAERSARLVGRHARALRAIARLPFVRLLALSGACAHGNATDDDVDVFLIAHGARVWTVTLSLMIASKLAGLRSTLCVNYVLGDDRLALPEHDAFTAAEIVGLRPLAGRATYRRFVQANGWLAARHPNFVADHIGDSVPVPEGVGSPVMEALLRPVGAVLERVARRLLEPYLHRRIGGAGVDLASTRLKLHAHDHRAPVVAAFEDALAEAEAPQVRSA
jgi:hypothetical protein